MNKINIEEVAELYCNERFNLKGKIAMVTGSSRARGKVIAKTLQKEGCTIILNGRNLKNLEESLEDIPNAFVIAGDVSNFEESKNIIKKILEKT